MDRAKSKQLSVAEKRKSIATLPVLATRAANGLGELVSLAQTAALAASRGETAHLAVLHSGLADPVHARIAANSLVFRIDHDDLVVLESSVLVNPVAVQHAKVVATTADTLFGNSLERTGRLELVDSLGSGLANDLTLANLALATTTANANAVDDKSLLGLVAETASLIRAAGAGSAVNDVQLTELPAANAENVSEDIRLLLLVKLFEILVGTH